MIFASNESKKIIYVYVYMSTCLNTERSKQAGIQRKFASELCLLINSHDLTVALNTELNFIRSF